MPQHQTDETQSVPVDDNTNTTGPNPLNILVVEDNGINRFVVREMLENEGHNITEAENGKVGAKIATTSRFDLIFMDISMPMFDGLEATKAIRDSGLGSFDSPIVALTAHALPQDVAKFKSAGMCDVLIKPISRALLLETLQSITRQPKSDDFKGSPARSGGIPFLNLEHLDELVSSIGSQKAAELSKLFLSEVDNEIKELLTFEAATPDFVQAKKIAHKLAGSAAMFGVEEFRSKLTKVEDFSQIGDSENLLKELSELTEVWGETKTHLREHFGL